MINPNYIIEVNVKAPDNRELDYSLEFYVERPFSVNIEKRELVRIMTEEGERFFAFIDADFGRGHLMCGVKIRDKEPLFNGREQIFNAYTGITIGNCLCKGGEVTNCCGYEISFNAVEDIPKDLFARIYYGVIKESVPAYEFITEDMAGELKEAPVGRMEKTKVVVADGDKLVVLLPCNEFLTAYKDNGFGGKDVFGTSLMGANGDIVLRVKGIDYKVFGEFMTVPGDMYIYVL